MSRLQSILLCIVLVATMILAAYTDVVFVGIVVVLIQVMIAAAPAPADARGRSIASPQFVPVMLAGAVATVITLWPQVLTGAAGTQNAAATISNGVLAGMVPGVAVGVIATLIAQILRRGNRANLVLAVGYTVTLCVLVTLPTAWIGAAQSFGHHTVIALGAAGVAVAMAVWAIPRHRVVVGAIAMALAALSGVAVAMLMQTITPASLVYGAATSASSAFFAITGLVVGRNWCQGRLRVSAGWGFPSATALALAAPAIYVAGQLISLA